MTLANIIGVLFLVFSLLSLLVSFKAIVKLYKMGLIKGAFVGHKLFKNIALYVFYITLLYSGWLLVFSSNIALGVSIGRFALLLFIAINCFNLFISVLSFLQLQYKTNQDFTPPQTTNMQEVDSDEEEDTLNTDLLPILMKNIVAEVLSLLLFGTTCLLLYYLLGLI